MYCGNCGNKLSKDQNFCPNCGTPSQGKVGFYGEKKKIRYGARSLICGLMSIPFNFVPCSGLGISLFFVIVIVGIGAMGIYYGIKGVKTIEKMMAILGIICSSISLGILLFGFLIGVLIGISDVLQGKGIY